MASRGLEADLRMGEHKNPSLARKVGASAFLSRRAGNLVRCGSRAPGRRLVFIAWNEHPS